MRLSDFMDERAIDPDLVVRDRDECIEKMVLLVRSGFGIEKHDVLVEKLQEREALLSTGIGEGIAIPHSISDEVSDAVIAVARASRGIEFNSLDGKPVYVIFLIIGSDKQPALHLKILARLARLVKHSSFVKNIKKAESAADILEAVREEEAKHII